MEGVEDEDSDFGSAQEAVEVLPVMQAPEPTDPLGPNAGEVDCDSPSPPKPITLDGGGKAKARAGKLVGTWNYTQKSALMWHGRLLQLPSWEHPIWRGFMAESGTSTFPMQRS